MGRIKANPSQRCVWLVVAQLSSPKQPVDMLEGDRSRSYVSFYCLNPNQCWTSSVKLISNLYVTIDGMSRPGCPSLSPSITGGCEQTWGGGRSWAALLTLASAETLRPTDAATEMTQRERVLILDTDVLGNIARTWIVWMCSPKYVPGPPPGVAPVDGLNLPDRMLETFLTGLEGFGSSCQPFSIVV